MALPTTRPSLQTAEKWRPQTVGELLDAEGELGKRLAHVAGKYLPADRALRLAINAVRKEPKLAQCTPVSFMGALMASTGLGLEPNTPRQLAFLIPYENTRWVRDPETGKWGSVSTMECQFQVGYKGMILTFYRSPLIRDVTAEAVYTGDFFDHCKGSEHFLKYKLNTKVPHGNGNLESSFCYTSLKDGESFSVLTLEDIHKSRARSQTWRKLAIGLEQAEMELAQANVGPDAKLKTKKQKDLEKARAKFESTPWEEWFGRMAAKTAIRRHASALVLDDDGGLSVAVALDEAADSQTIDLELMADPDMAKDVLRDGGDVPTIEGEDGGAPAEDGGASAGGDQEGERKADPLIVVDTKRPPEGGAAPAEATREPEKTKPKAAQQRAEPPKADPRPEPPPPIETSKPATPASSPAADAPVDVRGALRGRRDTGNLNL